MTEATHRPLRNPCSTCEATEGDAAAAGSSVVDARAIASYRFGRIPTILQGGALRLPSAGLHPGAAVAGALRGVPMAAFRLAGIWRSPRRQPVLRLRQIARGWRRLSHRESPRRTIADQVSTALPA